MDEEILADYLYEETEELKSFSASYESRSRDRFVSIVQEIYDLGSHEEYNTMFHTDRVLIDKKPRRLMDYLEIEAFIDRIEIVSLNEIAVNSVMKSLKEEKGFDKVSFDEAKAKITVTLPPLSYNALIELKQAVEGKYKNYEKALIMVRNQTAQQVRAGIQNEYISSIDAAKVSKEIGLVGQHYLDGAKIFVMAKKHILLGKYEPEDDKEKELAEKVPDALVILGKA